MAQYNIYRPRQTTAFHFTGDFNMNIDDLTDSNAIQFLSLLDSTLSQLSNKHVSLKSKIICTKPPNLRMDNYFKGRLLLGAWLVKWI